MKFKLEHLFKEHLGKFIAFIILGFLTFMAIAIYNTHGNGVEERAINLLKEYGYIILYFWCILEGEMALIMAGILSHASHMNLALSIFIAGLGGFTGDQIYFFIGRHNKKYIYKKLRSQRRKFAIAHVLLKKHGWHIIFLQRYMYGLRTVIPMSIGLTRYSAKKFAFINLLSAWAWAAITIIPAWYFGEEILTILAVAKRHWYLALPIAVAFIGGIYYFFHQAEKKHLMKRRRK